MAKAAPKKAVKPATKAAKPGRRPAAAKTTKGAKLAKPTKQAKKPDGVKAAAVSKDELRAQLEKAQNTIAALRIKSREAVREAKASAAQLTELEAKVAQLEKKTTAQDKPAKSDAVVTKPAKRRGGRAAKKVDVDVSDEAHDLSPAGAETEVED